MGAMINALVHDRRFTSFAVKEAGPVLVGAGPRPAVTGVPKWGTVEYACGVLVLETHDRRRHLGLNRSLAPPGAIGVPASSTTIG